MQYRMRSASNARSKPDIKLKTKKTKTNKRLTSHILNSIYDENIIRSKTQAQAQHRTQHNTISRCHSHCAQCLVGSIDVQTNLIMLQINICADLLQFCASATVRCQRHYVFVLSVRLCVRRQFVSMISYKPLGRITPNLKLWCTQG